MESTWLLILELSMVFLSFVETAEPPGGYYVTKYEHLDVDSVLNHKRLVHYYANCLLSKGPCPPQGSELKQILPEALRTQCMRCSEKQRTVSYRAIKRLKKEYPKVYSQLVEAYDPNEERLSVFFESFTRSTQAPPTTSAIIINRFGEEDTTNNEIPKEDPNKKRPYPPPRLTTLPIKSTIFTTPSTTSTRKDTSKTTVKKMAPTTQQPLTPKPILELTSSFLGSINKVFEVGTRVAGMVLSALVAKTQ